MTAAISKTEILSTPTTDPKSGRPLVEETPGMYGKELRPSSTEEEAKSRFVSALNDGVTILNNRHGYGRHRISSEILREISEGCSPNEDEVFQTMELLGTSYNDTCSIVTVSTAFRNARSSKGSNISAIDELTSRLYHAQLSHRCFSFNENAHRKTQLVENSEWSENPELTKQSSRAAVSSEADPSQKSEKSPVGTKMGKNKTELVYYRKSSLTESESGRCVSPDKVRLHESPETDIRVDGIFQLSKLTKDDQKESIDPSSRTKSPISPRAKRSSSLRSGIEAQPAKRPRTTI